MLTASGRVEGQLIVSVVIKRVNDLVERIPNRDGHAEGLLRKRLHLQIRLIVRRLGSVLTAPIGHQQGIFWDFFNKAL